MVRQGARLADFRIHPAQECLFVCEGYLEAEEGMTLDQLFLWHREQQDRFAWLAEHHKTAGGGQCHAVTRRNLKLAQFHADAVAVLKGARALMEPK